MLFERWLRKFSSDFFFIWFVSVRAFNIMSTDFLQLLLFSNQSGQKVEFSRIWKFCFKLRLDVKVAEKIQFPVSIIILSSHLPQCLFVQFLMSMHCGCIMLPLGSTSVLDKNSCLLRQILNGYYQPKIPIILQSKAVMSPMSRYQEHFSRQQWLN